jgi:methionyl-tRNA synthetase
LRKTDPARMNTVLHVTAEVLRQIGILIQPYMPGAATKLLDLLDIDPSKRTFEWLGSRGRLIAGGPLPPPQPVFPRYVEEPEQAQPA